MVLPSHLSHYHFFCLLHDFFFIIFLSACLLFSSICLNIHVIFTLAQSRLVDSVQTQQILKYTVQIKWCCCAFKQKWKYFSPLGKFLRLLCGHGQKPPGSGTGCGSSSASFVKCKNTVPVSKFVTVALDSTAGTAQYFIRHMSYYVFRATAYSSLRWIFTKRGKLKK